MSVKKGTFTFAFPFQIGTTGAVIADNLAKKLTEKGVSGKRPNMGGHTLPLFRLLLHRKKKCLIWRGRAGNNGNSFAAYA